MSNCAAMNKFLDEYKKSDKVLRMGQYFMVFYCNNSMQPDIFYVTDESVVKKEINAWLINHCYENELPMKRDLQVIKKTILDVPRGV